ncbi:MAG: chemotaxis protein [Desulfovibrio sp. S3730MH75]|nr:MAG: chemotaxis protein [Desulfovibrio sp. S3730MH75]
MNIRKQFIVGCVVFCLVITLVILFLISNYTRGTLMQEYRGKAEIMLHSMMAVRKHTGAVIRPEATKVLPKDQFVPELQSTSFTANGVFSRIPDQFKYELVYKTASTKPRNPRNVATADEALIIEELNELSAQGKRSFFEGVRTVNGVRYYVVAEGEKNKKSCMVCHGRPEDAPQSMKDRYHVANDSGYFRTPGAVECAQIASVPLATMEMIANQTLGSVIFAGVVFIAIALAFLLFGLNLIFSPISRITGIAKYIAEGDLESADEAVRKMRHNASGKFFAKRILKSGNEIGNLLESFEIMIGGLSGLVTEVRDSGDNVSVAGRKISATVGHIDLAVSSQAASTNEVTATSRLIRKTSRDLVDVMEDVAGSASESADLAEVLQDNISIREQSLIKLVDSTDNVSSRLGAIDEKANKINNIVTTIARIADHTNLLSLNAAIEAEKAGQFGQGFSVVAREIRRLADQTVIAAEDIELMVRDMQTAVSSGVMEMEKFNHEVRASVDEVEKMSSDLALITDRVRVLKPKFAEVSHAMGDQADSAEQINEAMSDLNESAVGTSGSIEDFKKTIASLNYTVQSLTGAVDGFKVVEVDESFESAESEIDKSAEGK